MSIREGLSDGYQYNLKVLWESLLPAPDIQVIHDGGRIERISLTYGEIGLHYLANVAKFFAGLAALPFTFVAASLFGRVRPLSPLPAGSLNEAERPTNAFGFAASLFQDQGTGTIYDKSGTWLGAGDWGKILAREPQRVDQDGRRLLPHTEGITLREGERVEDLFFNMMDHPREFARLLANTGCTAYRISLERSVLEPRPGEYDRFAVEKYRELFDALQAEGVEPWVTLHHFTNPQWFEDAGGFERAENIEGFVQYALIMTEAFPTVKNWMTFNEPGIRGLEGYVRGEHPPEVKDISRAAQVIRNLLVAHTRARLAMKEINPELNIGFTHQWLKFLPYGWNPIERITAAFFTSLVYTPIMGFCKDGRMQIQIPFRANVQLIDRRSDPRVADFLGMQAYGFPRVKVGFSGGEKHPGAADKVNNIPLIPGWLGFTAGSTCAPGGTMQYFGPSCAPDDLHEVAREAFSIPADRIPQKGVTETGIDANQMNFGDKHCQIDNQAQADWLQRVIGVWSRYNLNCFFLWTLHRNCEWRSGSMPKLGITTVRNRADGGFDVEETPAYRLVARVFNAWKGAGAASERVA